MKEIDYSTARKETKAVALEEILGGACGRKARPSRCGLRAVPKRAASMKVKRP